MNDFPTDPQLSGSGRLAVLRALSIVDTPNEPAFDQLTGAAALAARTPVALMTLVEPNRQWFKSAHGLKMPYAETRETPLSHSFCQYVVKDHQPLVVTDTRETKRLRDNLAIRDLNIIAYLGAPIVVQGEVVGALCVVDHQPRDWEASEIEMVMELAGVAASLMEMRAQLATLLSVVGDELLDSDPADPDETQKVYSQLVHRAQEQTLTGDAIPNPRPATLSRRPS
ncbi:MAG: GAF domain-containing protein [Anaerolineae bacterium]|jgi:GAF domain-containing protein|nr:GAF domain-containing protein [Anaerolineae bacterium]